MKKTTALLMAAALLLGGCSSRDPEDGSQSDITDGSDLSIGAAIEGPLEEASDISLFSNPPTLLTGDGTRAVITALVLDEQNRAIPGHDVSFSTDGGALQNIQATTNEAGEAIAELNLQGDFRNKSVTVTASVGEQSADVDVVSLGSDITMTAPEDLVVGQTADLTFTLLSGAGTPISNEIIQFVRRPAIVSVRIPG